MSIFARLCLLIICEIFRWLNWFLLAYLFATELNKVRLTSKLDRSGFRGENTTGRHGQCPPPWYLSLHRNLVASVWPLGTSRLLFCDYHDNSSTRLYHSALWHATDNMRYTGAAMPTLNDRSRGVRFKRPLSLNSGRIAETSWNKSLVMQSARMRV